MVEVGVHSSEFGTSIYRVNGFLHIVRAEVCKSLRKCVFNENLNRWRNYGRLSTNFPLEKHVLGIQRKSAAEMEVTG